MALIVDIPAPPTPVAAARILVLRNFIVYRSAWKLFITGFLEPVFYLFSIGIGVGQLIDSFVFHGEQVPYAAFVAPAMLATSAFNGALLDSTYNVFFKLKYDKLYDQMLATPLSTGDIARGEITWGLLRGSVYSAAFLLVMLAMGLVDSWWALLALPATVLIAFAFSAVCMALTTWMKSWQDFDKITLAQMPLFLFSATFFPDRGVRRRGAAMDHRGHAALPRGRAVPRAHHRGRDVGVGRVGRLSPRDGTGRPGDRAAPPRHAPAHLRSVPNTAAYAWSSRSVSRPATTRTAPSPVRCSRPRSSPRSTSQVPDS